MVFLKHFATAMLQKSPNPSIDNPIAFSNLEGKKADAICAL